MPSTFLGLNTGLSGLTYFQSALNTTAHNISNANTEGYTRQQINAQAANPVRQYQSYGMMGTGVTAKGVGQLRDAFYDNKYWSANSKQKQYESTQSNLSTLQTYMNEIAGDSGYTKWISKLSQSLQDIADNPSDYTTRISYTLTADSFTDTINELANNFQLTQKDLNDEIELVVSEINSLAKQIYELNQQIISIELKGSNANDLRDKRNLCIDKLSEYVDVQVEEAPLMFGAGVDAVPSNASTLSVRINNTILVDEMEYNEMMVVPRNQRINQNDAEGLVDVYWKNADGTYGEEFKVYGTQGRLRGLFDVRDGNNAEGFLGEIMSITDTPPSVTIKCEAAIDVKKLNVPAQGTITLNGKDYMYDGWVADYDEHGYLNNFTFQNMTMIEDDYGSDQRGVEVTAKLSNELVGFQGKIGDNNTVKGIPYYMARLNEMVRTFSSYMNELTSAGADENGDPGLDMYTAKDIYGEDYVLKGTMEGTGTITSADTSYYKLTALNWELNQAWIDDPAKVVVSYKSDVDQGNVDARPIIDKIIVGMTDQSMFEQGTVSQFMQAITTTMAVDISKMEVFAANHDDIRYTINNQRKSISGVDENEEAADLTKYQQLYNLASKVISVLNEVYNKLINDTGL